MSESPSDHPQPSRRPAPAGPFAGLLSAFPIAAKLAVTAGVAGGLFASIVLSYLAESLATPALIVGIAAGLIAAITLGRRQR